MTAPVYAPVCAELQGTVGGYYRHRRAGETACEPCLVGLRAYGRMKALEYRRRGGAKAPRKAKCGTDGGYSAHRRRNEPPCDDCRTAHADYARMKAREAKGYPLDAPRWRVMGVNRCGSVAGFSRHKRAGEKPCRACKTARNEAQRRWKKLNRLDREQAHLLNGGWATRKVHPRVGDGSGWDRFDPHPESGCGTAEGYADGCRCRACKVADRKAKR